MASYLYRHKNLTMVRVDWDTDMVWVPKSALARPADPQFVAERLAFNHPRHGAHFVYVDKAQLDESQLPRAQLRERVAIVLERQLAAERAKVDLSHRCA